MDPLREPPLVEYLRRSYQALDGLWFMMVEEGRGFEEALERDERVWRVLAKIQARKARELTQCFGNTPEELAECFSLKLAADGHKFTGITSETGVGFLIDDCPWLALLRRSGREHLALQVAQAICPAEGETWCEAFGGEYRFEMPSMACAGEEGCTMNFLRLAALKGRD